jgi:peptide chain release factor 2
LGGLFDLAAKQDAFTKLEEQMASPTFWQYPEIAKKVVGEMKHLKDQLEASHRLLEKQEEIQLMLELIAEEGEREESPFFVELTEEVRLLRKEMEAFELSLILSGPYDRNAAILELHPGAGGTESQDWAQMLLRMYTRWAERSGYKVETLDYLPGEEAGIKSVTLLVHGVNAYGYLKAEKGIHRLVRISPFDASGRRHTSFASVHVMPEIDNDIEIEIRSDEIKVDTYRSSGAGGQHVNTTDSAVRITHIPTNVIVTCQSERSQIKNRERAMKILKARLYEKKVAEQKKEQHALQGEQAEIGWGNQIRSYVFHPYNLVKDHRTQIEVGNVQAVMDGEINIFILGYLRFMLA